MTKVFIGGSRRMGRLNSTVRSRIDNIIDKSFTVFIGDANGVDKAIQKYCAEKRYEKIVVFCAGGFCRNNVGGWETRNIKVDRKTRDYKFYMEKDLHMAKEADYGFMIWDAKSTGTLSNILELLRMGKKILVYFAPEKTFVNIQTVSDLQEILNKCPEDEIGTFEKKLNLSNWFKSITIHQHELFS